MAPSSSERLPRRRNKSACLHLLLTHNGGMPKPRLPFTHRETARGKTFWYYRRGHGVRTRLVGGYGSAEFMRSYREADAGGARSSGSRSEGTFLALWRLYVNSPAWSKLSPATRKQRDNLMRVALERAGDQPLDVWNRKFIIASLDARASTPAQSRNFLGTLRSLFGWALSREHIEFDPTVGIKVERIRGDGFHTWTSEEMARFERTWPLGSRERLAYDLMLWTGLRRGDAARVGPQHVIDGRIDLQTEKNGQRVSVRILDPLSRSIAATQLGEDAFVVQARGKPFVKEAFGNWFSEACRAAGVPGSAHGLRKALAVKLAESGAGPLEIGAILGNDMGAMYARKASRSKLGDAAMDRLGNGHE